MSKKLWTLCFSWKAGHWNNVLRVFLFLAMAVVCAIRSLYSFYTKIIAGYESQAVILVWSVFYFLLNI